MYRPRLLREVLRAERQRRRAITLCELAGSGEGFAPSETLVVRCDVERDPAQAVWFAEMLRSLGINGSFYFHTRLNSYDPAAMRSVEAMGHEVGLHYECLDRCGGDFNAARDLFLKEVGLFRREGVCIRTAAFHGEPGIRRSGYRSNSDLLKAYPMLLDEAGLWGDAATTRGARGFALAADTFRQYLRFWGNIRLADETQRPLHILLHPHRWRSRVATTMLEVSRDIRQIAGNYLLKRRRYETVWDVR